MIPGPAGQNNTSAATAAANKTAAATSASGAQAVVPADGTARVPSGGCVTPVPSVPHPTARDYYNISYTIAREAKERIDEDQASQT